MLAAERHQKILALLQEKKAIKVSEVARLFDVTEMTIHRDLKLLAQEGLVCRTHGGALLVETSPEAEVEPACFICGKIPARHQRLRLFLEGSHRPVTACCPHCTVLAQTKPSQRVNMAMVSDFLTGTIVAAEAASYVVGGKAVTCCSPPVTAFHSREMAESFARGFGGAVANLAEAIDLLDRHYGYKGSDVR